MQTVTKQSMLQMSETTSPKRGVGGMEVTLEMNGVC